LGTSATITVTNNKIGVSADGFTATGNGNYGVKNTNVPGAIRIGGEGAGNIIAHNSGFGVVLENQSGTQMSVVANSIFNNTNLGLNLAGGTETNNVTANDSGDGDSGPNDLLNFPVINAFSADGTPSVDYDIALDVPSNTEGYRIEFFKNTAADSSGHGEGEIYLGAIDVTGPGTHTGTLTASVSISEGDIISSTTTRKTGALSYDVTSEFSANETAISSDPANLAVTKTVASLIPGEYAIPGNDMVYTFSVVNQGSGTVTTDSIVLIDELPAEIQFFNGDHDGPGPSTATIGFEETGTSLSFNPAADALYSDSTTKPADMSECDYAT